MAGCNSCYNPAKKCHSACDPVFTKVDVLPEPYLATHGHAYITPDDKVYVLDHEGVEFVLLNSVGGTTKAKNIRDVTPTEGGYSINYTDGTNDVLRIPKQITYDIQGDYLVASNGAEFRLPKSEDTNTTYTIEGNELVGSDGTRVALPKKNGTIFASDVDDLLNQDQENPKEVGTFAAIFTKDFNHELYVKDDLNSWNVIANYGRDTTYTIEGTTLVSSNGDRQEIPQPEPISFGRGLVISDNNIVTLDPSVIPPDNYVKDVRVSRKNNVVKLTYTYVDETTKEVEFTDNDTVTLAYDDTQLRNLINNLQTSVTALQQRRDNDTIYNDAELRNLIAGLRDSVTELQRRRDNDTIYNDTEVRKLISDLTVTVRNLQQNSTRYDDTQLRTLITNLERRVVSYVGGSGINISGGTVSLNFDGAVIPVGSSNVSLRTLGNIVHGLTTKVDANTTYRIDKFSNALVGSDGSISNLPVYSLREVPLNIYVRGSSNIMQSITRESYSQYETIKLNLPDDFSSRVKLIRPTDTCVVEMTVTIDFEATLPDGLIYRYLGNTLYFVLDHGKSFNMREAVFHTDLCKGFVSYITSISNNVMVIRASLQIEPRVKKGHVTTGDGLSKVVYNLPIRLSSEYKDVPQVFDTSSETVKDYTSIKVTVKNVSLNMNFHRVSYELDRK